MSDQETFYPDDWEIYQRMVDFGPELARRIRDCLAAEQHQQMYELIKDEHPEVVDSALWDLYNSDPVRDVVSYLEPLIYFSLKWMVETKQKKSRKEIASLIFALVLRHLKQSKRFTESGISFLEKSKKGSDRKSEKSQQKHQEVLFKARTLLKVNSRLSKNSIANLMVERGETDYGKSSVLRILRDLDEYLDWDNPIN